MQRTFINHNVTAESELLPAERVVRVRIRPMRGVLRWSRPDSAALRSMADMTIEESAYPSFYRQGRAQVVDTDTGWNVFYTVGD